MNPSVVAEATAGRKARGCLPEAFQDILAHIHTAGILSRGELDESEEINDPPIMRKLVVTLLGLGGQAPAAGRQRSCQLGRFR